ncbi:TetR/AcrR family transcriptional regulator [Acidovorax sp. sic0104]|uniref:TetR/AcrR family transcriptional regulator n=1 Tax=Acidovorax sp. sic0104 TaxID=2854784 RepID=UPI001C458718|nr:TetR family transcriptional regulator [Acidovorax sp. sic0104]MBV7541134.1 TetR/AcrR family transcriptional regulator [Acidovorax sp. sic0104]
MKVSKAQAAENRQGILDAAARLYRERGLAGVGVADITRDAGLTHGGLYRHFESKDALVREACARAFDWSIAPLDGHTPNATVADRIKSYLSPAHRDAPGRGCPAAALAVDAARAGPELSEVFASGIERNIQRFTQLLADHAPAPAEPFGADAAQVSAAHRARAMEVLATMVGGLVLARATAAAQPALSQELLTTLQEQLIQLLDTPQD